MTRYSVIPIALMALTIVNESLALGSKHYFTPNEDQAVELSTVKSLIFRKDSMTTGRRTAPVPQLSCVGGGACGGYYEPTVVHCTNIGVDYASGDPTWKCTAELENGLRLGTTDVVCEGYRDRDDPYILRGSCGLEYTLLGSPVRNQGNQQAYASDHSSGSYQNSYKPYPTSTARSTSSKGSWANWLVGGFLIWLFLRYLNRSAHRTVYQSTTSHHTPGSAGGGGGTGWFGNGGGGGGWGNWRGFGGGRPDADCGNNGRGVGGGGGGSWWQGLGLGAATGYFFGARNNRHNTYVPPVQTTYVPPVHNVYGNAGNGGYGGGTYGRPAPPPPPQHTETTAAPATQTATGYGNTRRRG